MPRPARTSRRAPPAAALVRTWLGELGKTQDWLAAALGLKPQSVWAWLSGSTAPVLETAVVLERLSDGAVPATSWADPREVSARVDRALAHG